MSNKSDKYDSFNRYSSQDQTKYVVARTAPLTTTGENEIVAMFELRQDAEEWVRLKYGRRWRQLYAVGMRVT